MAYLYLCTKLHNCTTLLILYYSMIYPYLQYCNMIWASTFPSNLDRLVVLQKRAIRVVFKLSFNGHTIQTFKDNNILKFHDLLYSFWNHLLIQQSDWSRAVRFEPESHYLDSKSHLLESQSGCSISFYQPINCIEYFKQSNRKILRKYNIFIKFLIYWILYIPNATKKCFVIPYF